MRNRERRWCEAPSWQQDDGSLHLQSLSSSFIAARSSSRSRSSTRQPQRSSTCRAVEASVWLTVRHMVDESKAGYDCLDFLPMQSRPVKRVALCRWA